MQYSLKICSLHRNLLKDVQMCLPVQWFHSLGFIQRGIWICFGSGLDVVTFLPKTVIRDQAGETQPMRKPQRSQREGGRRCSIGREIQGSARIFLRRCELWGLGLGPLEKAKLLLLRRQIYRSSGPPCRLIHNATKFTGLDFMVRSRFR